MKSFDYHRSKEGLNYYTIPQFDNSKLVKTCFTGRLGGSSSGSYRSLNLGLKTNDNVDDVLENYIKIGKELNISMDQMVFSDQVHQDNIKIVTKNDAVRPFEDNPVKNTDGIMTNEKGVALVSFYADCVPLYLFDPIKKVIALVHGGWRGTVSRIASKALTKMEEEFGSNPEDCLAAIGPSIGKCCFEVDGQVAEKFNKEFTNIDSFVFSKGCNKYLIDLWKANRIDLEEKGLLRRNIIYSQVCTMCNKDILFSHRGDNGITGRMAAIIQLI